MGLREVEPLCEICENFVDFVPNNNINKEKKIVENEADIKNRDIL